MNGTVVNAVSLASALVAAPWAFAVGVAVKATLVLAVAGLLTWALRRQAAATRHLVWTLAVAGVLLIPVLSVLLPALVVSVDAVPIPAILRASAAPTPTTERRAVSAPLEGEAFPAVRPTSDVPAEIAPETTVPPVPDLERVGAETAAYVGAAEDVAAPGRAVVLRSRLAAAGPAVWLFGIWLLGTVLLLARLLAARIGMRRFARGAAPVEDAEWTGLLRDLAWIVEVERPVQLLRSPDATMPMTWGTRRPVILLPATADEWPAERRRVVLLHELAHVERRDCLTQWLASAACALHWMNPLAWYAAHRLRVEREWACDDRVLDAGTRRHDYAGHLLEMARAFRSPALAGIAAVSMARPSQLEGRLLAVLDGVRDRRGVTRRAAVTAGAVALALVLPLAALRPAQAAPAYTEVEAAGPLAVPAVPEAPDLPSVPGFPHAVGAPSVPPSPAPLQDPERIETRQFNVQAGGTLHLDLRTGGAVRVVGWDSSAVRIRAELGGRDWRDTRLSFDRTDDGVRVTSRQERNQRSSSTSHHFVINVPKQFNVRTSSAGGELHFADVRGTFAGATGGGQIYLNHLTGEANLRTGGGSIVVTDSRLDGEVRTGGGNVTLSRVEGGLQGRTGGGRVRRDGATATADAASGTTTSITTTTTTAGGVVSISKAGGAIFLASAPNGATLATGGGAVRLGSAGGPVSVATGGGAISIGPVRGSVEARTGSGAIVVQSATGPVSATTGNGAVAVTVLASGAGHDVEITSGTGAVSVTLPPDFSGEFDVETAYTRGHDRVCIVSDFPQRLSESTTWEAGRGTPRKTVRLTGTANGGRNRVRIRTVNGHVILRAADRDGSTRVRLRSEGCPMGDGMEDGKWNDPEVDVDVDVDAIAEITNSAVSAAMASVNLARITREATRAAMAAVDVGRITEEALAEAAVSLDAAAQGGDCTYTATRTANLSAGGARLLEVVASSGLLRIEGRAGLNEVRVRGTACASVRGALDDIRLETRRDGDRITVEALLTESRRWRNDNARLDMVLEVPAELVLDVQDGSGPVTIRRVAALTLDDGSGAIDIAEVRGDVRIKDGSGEIRLVSVGGNVDIDDGSGEILVRDVQGSVRIDDGSGSVIAENIRGNFTVINDGSGTIRYANIGGQVRIPADKRRE